MARINESFSNLTPAVDEQTKRAAQKADTAAQKVVTPAVDARAALVKLTSGQTLTPDERVILGMSPATPATQTATTPIVKTTTPTTTTPTAVKPTSITPTVSTTDASGAIEAARIAADAQLAAAKYSADVQAKLAAEEKIRQGQSAYDLLFTQFAQYGMGALVEPLKQFIQQGISASEFTLRLRDTDAYKKRFAANAARIAKGLSALNEAEYIGLEDQYQNIMRQYGLPASYYTRGDMGRQEGFEKFLANDVSAAELEDRVITAQSRVLNANPEVLASLKQFYPGIGDGDILAYTLDPEKALTDIKRKVTAAEIGGAAMQRG